MEVILQDLGYKWRDTLQTVSILVLMEVILQVPDTNQLYDFHKVSILVLMEVILQDHQESSGIIRKDSFNPCFNGSYSSGSIMK